MTGRFDILGCILEKIGKKEKIGVTGIKKAPFFSKKEAICSIFVSFIVVFGE